MTKRVLLIDDDPDDRELFCEAFEEIAPEIICQSAFDFRKALLILDNPEIQKPDIIFLDINMPSISGWQCLIKLKENEAYKNIPVIMYSTSSDRQDLDKCIQLGAAGFLIKPQDFKVLKKGLETIAMHLNNNTLLSLTINSPLIGVDEK